MYKVLILYIVISVTPVGAASLFDSAVSGGTTDSEIKPEINGYVRGNTYLGRETESHDLEYKSQQIEFSAKTRAKKEDYGEGFWRLRDRVL